MAIKSVGDDVPLKSGGHDAAIKSGRDDVLLKSGGDESPGLETREAKNETRCVDTRTKGKL